MNLMIGVLLFAVLMLNELHTASVGMLSQLGSQVQTTNDAIATVMFAGDISLDKPIRTDNGSNCAYEGLIANVSKYFREVDYNIVNLEAPFVTKEMSERVYLPQKGIHNMAWPEGIAALTSVGIKGVTIANNHIGDFGGDAVVFTNEHLKKHGFDVVGLSYGLVQPYTAQEPLIKIINGVRVGILAYCGDNTGECRMYRVDAYAGTAVLDKATVEKDILKLKRQVDVIAVFLHWGTEYMSIPNETQRELAVILSGLGVNLIVGSHPHVLQGHEWINDTLVHYSLGNFVFHPHATFMGSLGDRKNKSEIHRRAIEQSKKSRGPASYTELLKIEFNTTGIKDAYFLPVRVHVDPDTFCLYPRAIKEDNWLKICGEEDRNCYAPRHGEPVYP